MNLRSLIIIVVSVFVLAIIGLVLYVQNQVQTIVQNQTMHEIKPVTGPIYANVLLLDKGVFTYNFSHSFMTYGAVSYALRNVSSVNFTIGTYTKSPVPQIYLVDVGDYCLELQCFNEQALYNSLYFRLNHFGRILNTTTLFLVGINKINDIPPGSIVIIPSGLLPNILLPDATSTNGCIRYSNYTLLTLLQQGDSVIYIGRNFSTAVTCAQQTVNASPVTLKDLQNYGMNTIQLNPANTAAFTVNTPLAFKSPTFFFGNATEFYGVWAKNVTNGTLVSFSNNIAGGWNNNTQTLANDLATVIESKFWLGRFAYGTFIENGIAQNGAMTLFTANQTVIENWSAVTPGEVMNSSYSLITMRLANSNQNYEINIPFRLRYVDHGVVYISPELGQTESGELTAYVTNFTGQQITTASIYNIGFNKLVQTVDMGPMTNDVEVVRYPNFVMQPGYYVVELKANGETYSDAIFKLDDFNITKLNLDFKNDTFYFQVNSHQKPINGVQYRASLNNLYQKTGTVEGGVINYTLPKNSQVNYGLQQFRFVMLGNNYTINYAYINTAAGIPVFYIEFGIAAVVVIILNRILVAPPSDDYYIDLPSFPPSRREKVKENPQAVIDVFDLVNHYYHWKYMPLTVGEIRTGIGSNLKYGNASIAITSQNTLAVLNKLIEGKQIISADDYFAPKKWMDYSKHDIEYLVVFRRLRDFCVANAILFTDLDMAQGTDMIMTSKTSQSYVTIYSSLSGMRELTINTKSKLFIVFLDDEKKQGFLDNLYKSYNEESEVLKMAIDYGYVKLVDTYHLNSLGL
ncbi:MAG: hypothetical protein KGH72_03210 [Candidatus Micrarchaeota archaeon]|nr:hypothetical protein [Candidatus Micrarchaeota archaeon]